MNAPSMHARQPARHDEAVTVASPTRRRFLRASAAVSAAGLCVGFLGGCALPVIPKRPKPGADDAAGWIRHDGSRYTLHVPRAEMGQHIGAALAQVAAIELGIAPDQLQVQLHHTAAIRRVRATVGSESIKDFALPLAQACATLREAVAQGLSQDQLCKASAEHRERPRDELRWWQASKAGAAGDASGSTARGATQAGRPALFQERAIITGQPLFVADIRLPGMVYGRVLRAPVTPEWRSQPVRWDEAAARAVPGFVALVNDPLLALSNSQGLGIVAQTPASLDAVARALAVQWQTETGTGMDTLADLIDIDRRGPAPGDRAHTVRADRIEPAPRGQSGPAWDVDLRIDTPVAAHAPLEPRCAVAQPTADPQPGMRVWVGTQDVFYQRDVIAKRLGLDDSQVWVQGQRVGGAFGGKTLCTVELEAAVLARATGRAVKVQWTREQEFLGGFHRPPTSHRIRARLHEGRLQTWWHGFASSHILFTNAVLPPWLQRLTSVICDDGVARGAALPYRCPQVHTGFDLVRLPVLTGPWRGLGAGPNGLAIESAIDECAWAAGMDPLAFRLAHLDDPRLGRCLQRVAQAAGWSAAAASSASSSPQPPVRPEAGPAVLHGRGLACGIYKQASHAAVVADVEVSTQTGVIRVTRLWCAHDAGRVVLPDVVRAQCEGNLVWGLGMVLIEALDPSQLADTGFGRYPMPRMADVPPITTVLIDEGEPPTGAGETAIVAAGAAIANAVRAATGHRFGRFPIRPADVLQALQAAPGPRR